MELKMYLLQYLNKNLCLLTKKIYYRKTVSVILVGEISMSVKQSYISRTDKASKNLYSQYIFFPCRSTNII